MENKLVALGLSFIIPGLGQIYNKELNKGILFVFCAFLCIFFFPAYLLLWMYSMYDAYTTAERISMASSPHTRVSDLPRDSGYSPPISSGTSADFHEFSRAERANREIKLMWGDVTSLLEEAYALLNKGRYEEGLAVSERALDHNPRNAIAWGYKGWALLEMGYWTASLSASEQAIRYDPTEAWMWNNKGCALLDLGRINEALAALDHALRLDPNDTLAQKNRTRALHKTGNGYGQLTVMNGSGHDAVLLLAWKESNSVFVKTRIRSGSSEEISGIPSGVFWLFFSFEQEGDTISRFKFSDPVEFTTDQESGKVRYSQFNVTLHPVAGGTARTESVSAMQFPNG